MSLAERSRRSGIGSPASVDSASVDSASVDSASVDSASTPPNVTPTNVTPPNLTPPNVKPPNVKHCWVIDSPLSPGRWPGLLLSWRRGPAGWQGLAAWVVDDEDGPVVLQAWVGAEHLQALGGLSRPAG